MRWLAATPAGRIVPSSLYGPARRLLTPNAAGRTTGSHICLTFDDGPDAASTPRFLDLLADRNVSATFFLVGERAQAHPELVRRIVDAGHELAVHGWTHRCVALLDPPTLREELARTRDLLAGLGAADVARYRPPYGIATASSAWAAREAGLTPLLWTAWGRDWSARATPASIARVVGRTLRPGGTVLLHDTDAYSAPGSWVRTLEATARLLDHWHAQGWSVGPAREHAR